MDTKNYVTEFDTVFMSNPFDRSTIKKSLELLNFTNFYLQVYPEELVDAYEEKARNGGGI